MIESLNNACTDYRCVPSCTAQWYSHPAVIAQEEPGLSLCELRASGNARGASECECECQCE
eukprot:scaffold21567_cov36-Cyclotella_meneghiniana.AAC.1